MGKDPKKFGRQSSRPTTSLASALTDLFDESALAAEMAAALAPQPEPEDKATLAKRLTGVRDRAVNRLRAVLERKRPDGTTLMGRPDKDTLGKIQDIGKRIREVDARISEALGDDPKLRRWRNSTNISTAAASAGRKQYEDEIFDSILKSGSLEPMGSNGRPLAIVTMGAPGSGKSTMVPNTPGLARIDIDYVKEFFPDYQMRVANSDSNAGNFNHGEAREICMKLEERVITQGRNLIMDGTGRNVEIWGNIIKKLKARGYEVRLVMPHVPADVGIDRVVSRANVTGRMVPLDMVKQAYDQCPRNFQTLARLADSAILVDNVAGNKMIMRYENGAVVEEDAPAAASFRSKYGN